MNRYLIFVILYVFLNSALYGEEKIESGEEKIDLMAKARAEKNIDEAIKLYTTVIKESPELAKAIFNRGKLYKKKKEYEKALDDFSNYIRLSPDEFVGYYVKGRIFTRLKKYALASKTITAYIRRYPEDPKGYFERGYISRYFAKKLMPAINDFSKVIELSPQDSTAYIERGLAYLGIGDFERAIEDFTNGIKYDPHNSIAFRERGRCYKELKEYETAVADFKRSLEYNPDNIWTYHFVAATYYKMEELDHALDYANQAIERGKSDITYDLRANIQRDLGAYGKALEDVEEAFKLGGKYYFTRGSILFLKNENNKAFDDFMEVFKENEDAEKEKFNILVMERVDGLSSFVGKVKEKYDDLLKKYGAVE